MRIIALNLIKSLRLIFDGIIEFIVSGMPRFDKKIFKIVIRNTIAIHRRVAFEIN